MRYYEKQSMDVYTWKYMPVIFQEEGPSRGSSYLGVLAIKCLNTPGLILQCSTFYSVNILLCCL